MNKTIVLLLVAHMLMARAPFALAMPSQKEISDVRPLVIELMEPTLNAFKAKKISGSKVGDKMLELANTASTDAAVFFCMKGAVSYYVRDKAYDKAAGAVELIMVKFPDMPAETLLEITTAATRYVSAKSASRLFDIHKMASRRAANSQKLVMLKKQLEERPADKDLIYRYAELSAACGNWEAALQSFAKLEDDTGRMAKGEQAGSVSAAVLADFWWDYQAQENDARDVIRQRAVMYYQNAIKKGELDGLKKVIAEKRIAEDSVTPIMQGPKESTSPNGLIHRWSFSGNLKDSVGNRDGKAVAGMVSFEKGQVCIRPGGGYVDLGADVLPGGGNADYTLEVWATKYGVKNWARVFQIPDSWGVNDYLWTWNVGKDPKKWACKLAGCRRWDIRQGNGTGIGVENHFVVVYGHDEKKRPYYHVCFLRGGKVYWHTQSGLLGSMFNSHKAFWLGHSQEKNDQTAYASYNEVRIWNRAFTHEEIMRSAKLGPDKLPE